ncbi:unnamed protein product [Pipistrellus nathusii]|uniref:Uncharacterized protein n=1 Tax=Pipistrellus nathusii TaxID=59473 RepID=A0ABP0AK94_PIPNA
MHVRSPAPGGGGKVPSRGLEGCPHDTPLPTSCGGEEVWCSVPGTGLPTWHAQPYPHPAPWAGLGRLQGSEVGTSQGRDPGLAPACELKADALFTSQVFHVAALLNPRPCHI